MMADQHFEQLGAGQNRNWALILWIWSKEMRPSFQVLDRAVLTPATAIFFVMKETD